VSSSAVSTSSGRWARPERKLCSRASVASLTSASVAFAGSATQNSWVRQGQKRLCIWASTSAHVYFFAPSGPCLTAIGEPLTNHAESTRSTRTFTWQHSHARMSRAAFVQPRLAHSIGLAPAGRLNHRGAEKVARRRR